MAGLLDYIEEPFRAVGGLLGMGSQPPPAAAVAAPAPAQPAATSAPQFTPPTAPVHGWFVNALDRGFLGGGIAAHDQQALAQATNQYQNQRLQQIYHDLPDSEKPAFLLDPSGYAKAVDSGLVQTGKPGETIYRPPASGGNVFAPVTGVTPSGVGYAQTPTATTNTGGLPTIQSAGPGVTVSPMAPITPPAQTPGPAMGGPPASAPMLGQGAPLAPQAIPAPQGGPPPPQAGPQGAPRGIRNNNPGNVRALPNGQMWQGQTGVDPAGYAVFATPQDGVRATLTNLHSYGSKDGVNTPQGLAQRWAPQAAGNNTANYASYIAKTLGVKPTDKIDLTDTATQGKAAQAIFEFENGLKPGAAAPTGMAGPGPAPQPPQVGQAQPASTPPGYLPSSVQGRTSTLVSPNEAIRLGLAPGRWERDPAGKLVQASPAPKGDTDRVDSLAATTQGLHLLLQEQDAFLKHNKNVHTGLAYVNPEVHGVGLNPYLAYQEGHSPDVKALSASEGKQLFMVKPENAGARILQSELPFWQIQTQNMSATPEVNLGIRNDTAGKLTAAQKQSDFYQKYIYEHGNLNGADQAFNASQQGASQAKPPQRGAGPTGRTAPVTLSKASPDADFARLSKGAQYIGPDGVLRTK